MVRVGLVSLGCAKNRVDSEVMLGHLFNKGYTITDNAEEADVLIINTCGFIQSAKEESIETILEMAQYKEKGKCQALVVTGCLSKKYHDELEKELPEVDGFLGTNEIDKIGDIVEQILAGKKIAEVNKKDDYLYDSSKPRILTTPNFYAYVKVAEGCNNRCHYCTIPVIRGAFRSRKKEDILNEINLLGERGVKEILLIAQDTTSYGLDLYGKPELVDLLQEINNNNNINWIRVLYSYPIFFSDELIKTIKNLPKVCHYLDIPLQHCSDKILTTMNRKGNKQFIKDLVYKLRNEIPDIVLRTSFIVGLPGETEDDFNELLEFMQEMQFDRVGIFTYSREDGTVAYNMENQVPENLKKQRWERAMQLQQEISYAKNQQRVGKTFLVLVEGITSEGLYFGRSQYEAPEVDGKIFFSSNQSLASGNFVNIRITEAYEYDLLGEIVHESS